MANVLFKVGTKAQFEGIQIKNKSTLYWLTDTQELYKGDILFGTGALASKDAAGLLSAEDYKKLQELIVTGGTVDLTPVDSTIVIDGKKIGVAISKDAGNALVPVDGGLFVPTVEVPEYAIEKQATAEDGYATSYKLKKTVNGETTYVGDVINIGKDMVLQGVTLEVVAESDKPYTGAVVGDPYIHMVFNDASASDIYVPVKGLVDTYVAGDGIAIADNVISVKIAAESHGLTAVDGSMAMLLATAKNDGAMSKEDKAFIDSIPYAYVAKKYEIADVPEGTLVDYYEKEIRIMCPADAEYHLQNVGVGGDPNSYYVTLKTYAPDGAVGYVENLGGQVDKEILKDIKADNHGRRYQPTWLAVAKHDAASDVWSYYGANSTDSKYIGWDYKIDWYNADGVIINSDNIRINLSNEDCHFTSEPYYMAGYAESSEVEELRATVAAMEETFTWGSM